MKLFEIEFTNGLLKRVWSYDVFGALEALGYSRHAMMTIVYRWKEISHIA